MGKEDRKQECQWENDKEVWNRVVYQAGKKWARSITRSEKIEKQHLQTLPSHEIPNISNNNKKKEKEKEDEEENEKEKYSEFFLVGVETRKMKMVEEYCWVITQVAVQSCCSQSGSSVLKFQFQLADHKYTEFWLVQNLSSIRPFEYNYHIGQAVSAYLQQPSVCLSISPWSSKTEQKRSKYGKCASLRANPVKIIDFLFSKQGTWWTQTQFKHFSK